MAGKKKTISSINKKIQAGGAVALTEAEFLRETLNGRMPKLDDIDVVTIEFQTETSGTAAMINVPITEQGVFTRAEKFWLNGVLGYPGPAPNERLGQVEGLFFADQRADGEDADYNGAKLFLDLLKKKEIMAECLSVEGDTYETSLTIDEMSFARMYIYNCFLNKFSSGETASTKTSPLKTIRGGSKILLNKAPGIVIGCGTCSSPEQRALSIAADMFEMDPECMHASRKENRAELTNSVTLAIPILTEEILKDLAGCLMEDSPRTIESSGATSEETGAGYLKKLISTGKFLLISSNMHLDNWF